MYIRVIAIGCFLSIPAWADQPVSFNEHIRPIFADKCFACHGQDVEHREADLRLDTAAGAEVVFSADDWEQSELWRRISTEDGGEQMPPSDSLKSRLSKEQLDLVRRWMEQGAVYEDHWAFAAVERPPLPQTACGMVEHPVDRFIQARLEKHDLTLSPQATDEVLIRRVTLDLTGLPPSPEDVERFLADTAPDSYERLVDRLLASPNYGEHFARYWLDAVRYADTHGRHFDNVRSIWPYRDWVVQAFNRNLPFDQFTVEQLAGDLLPSPSIDQLVASGYNRSLQTTSEGGSIEAEEEMRTTADRVDTTSAVWMGLTTNCASCHDHKFDPLTQKEFYSLGAIFKGLDVRPWDGNVRFAGPIAVVAGSSSVQDRINQISSEIELLEAAVTRRAAELVAGELALPELTDEAISYEVIWAEDADLPSPDSVLDPPLLGRWAEGASVPLVSGQRALLMDGGGERPILFTAGDVILTVRDEARAFVSVYLDPSNPPRALSLEFISDEKTYRKVWGDAAAFGLEPGPDWILAGPLPTVGQYAELELTAAEAGLKQEHAYTGLRLAQSAGRAWWDHVRAEYTSPSARSDPLLSENRWVQSVHSRVHEYPPTIALPHDISYLVGISSVQRTDKERGQLADWYRDYIYAPLRGPLEPEVHAARRLLAEQVFYESTLPVSLVSRERDDPLPAHVLVRGQYDQLGDPVQAATPAFLPPLSPAGERITRLDFARWLVSAPHPLTSRVTVNRFWQQLFGAGLVRTPGDFGVQGQSPTHPQLLDWLASEFRLTGWDVKKMVRLLVTSRTYRQGSRVTPELLEADPSNRLLARSSRLRLDAEVLRDQALALSGLLCLEMEGPPVKPYQPINIWEPVAFGGSNTKVYVQDHDSALYRRSLYSFWKRTAPPPSMTIFDAPSREMFCVGRNRSDTPLQALALQNDVQHVEAARAFAERLIKHSDCELERLDYAFRSATSRRPKPDEHQLLADTLANHQKHFEANVEAARQLVQHGESTPSIDPPLAEFAAWTMIAQLLLNLDETLNRN